MHTAHSTVLDISVTAPQAPSVLPYHCQHLPNSPVSTVHCILH